MLASIAETWVITRANNRERIEQALPSILEYERLHFVYVDLPLWARAWKRGARGMRLYYLLWQLAALHRARSLNRSLRFDLVWHLTWANAWFGSLAPLVGPPFVYGPVGGCVSPPWRLVSSLGVRGALYEISRYVLRSAARYLNPLARISWVAARIILVQNQETGRWFPSRHRSKVRVFPNAICEMTLQPTNRARPKVAIFPARLLPWKGGHLALRALSEAPGWELVICGAGRDERRLRRIAGQLAIEKRVRFTGWLEQRDLWDLMSEARVLLFPSLHDECGFAVVEALAAGLSVICLDRGGPPVLVGPSGLIISSAGSAAEVAARLARDGLLQPYGVGATKAMQRAGSFTVQARGAALGALLASEGLLTETSP